MWVCSSLCSPHSACWAVGTSLLPMCSTGLGTLWQFPPVIYLFFHCFSILSAIYEHGCSCRKEAADLGCGFTMLLPSTPLPKAAAIGAAPPPLSGPQPLAEISFQAYHCSSTAGCSCA